MGYGVRETGGSSPPTNSPLKVPLHEEDLQKVPLTMNVKAGEEEKGEIMEDANNGSSPGGFDTALEMCDSWGWWQKKVFVIAHFSQVFCAIHAVSSAFLSYTPDHWCRVEGLEEVVEDGRTGKEVVDGAGGGNFWSNSTLDYRNLSIPWSAKEGYSKCEYYSLNYTSLLPLLQDDPNDYYDLQTNDSKASCDSWIFDDSVFKSSLVSEFFLVCDRRWMMATVQASFMSGLLIGSLVMGQLSDRFGRRIMCVICAILLCIVSTCAAFVTTYVQFLALRFIIALLCAGLMIITFVLVLEVVKPSARTLTGMLYAGFFGMGITILPGIAYFLRDWRHLELTIGISSVLLVSYIWILPESPRWLASQGRGEEAVKILKEVARTNGRTLPPDHVLLRLVSRVADNMKSEELEKKRAWYSGLASCLRGQASLLRTRVMRRRSLICFYLWFAAASVYYGLIFSGANIKADPFLMIFISGLVELPSCVVFIHSLNSLGRRPTMLGLFMAIAVCLLAILAVPEDQIYVNFFLVNLGKFFTTAVFQLQFLYASELFPTSVRNMAVGTCSMMARIGCVITPYIITMLGDVHYVLPSTLFGILSMVAGLLTLLLPETNNMPLPEIIDEVEAMDK